MLMIRETGPAPIFEGIFSISKGGLALIVDEEVNCAEISLSFIDPCEDSRSAVLICSVGRASKPS
jgi:hypothetical protein